MTSSTTEAEYIATLDAAKEAIWLHRLSADFSAKRRLDHPPLTIYCDSQRVIHLIRNPVYHVKTRHIEVSFHHIQELITEQKFQVWKIDTEMNITDCLTKPLLEQRFRALRTMMGLRQETEQMRAKRGLEKRSRKHKGHNKQH